MHVCNYGCSSVNAKQRGSRYEAKLHLLSAVVSGLDTAVHMPDGDAGIICIRIRKLVVVGGKQASVQQQET